MGYDYDINAYKQQQEQEKKAKTEDDVDKEILEEAEKIEKMNYRKSKDARKLLERSAKQQKETTNEMQMQGEKIGKAKKTALKVHSHAGEAEELADKLDKESHFFSFRLPFAASISKWWNKDSKEESNIERIKKNAEMDEGIYPDRDESESFESESTDEENEYIKGQGKTDKEMKRILKNVKQINKEAGTQKRLSEKQRLDLNDIKKVNEYTKKRVDKTDKELKKGL